MKPTKYEISTQEVNWKSRVRRMEERRLNGISHHAYYRK